MKTKIHKWGNSLAVRVPKSFAVHCGIEDGTVVELSVKDGGLFMEPEPHQKPKYSLEELLAGVTRKNRHREIDFGPPVGRELL